MPAALGPADLISAPWSDVPVPAMVYWRPLWGLLLLELFVMRYKSTVAPESTVTVPLGRASSAPPPQDAGLDDRVPGCRTVGPRKSQRSAAGFDQIAGAIEDTVDGHRGRVSHGDCVASGVETHGAVIAVARAGRSGRCPKLAAVKHQCLRMRRLKSSTRPEHRQLP